MTRAYKFEKQQKIISNVREKNVCFRLSARLIFRLQSGRQSFFKTTGELKKTFKGLKKKKSLSLFFFFLFIKFPYVSIYVINVTLIVFITVTVSLRETRHISMMCDFLLLLFIFFFSVLLCVKIDKKWLSWRLLMAF